MTTTTIIVEILVIGLFTSIWILLICVRLSFLDSQFLKDLALQLQPWSAPAFLIAAAIFYQVGLLMNTISRRITKRFSQKGMRDQVVLGKDFEYVRATVYQKGSTEVVRNLELYMSFTRLARSGILNFLLIAVALFLYGGTLAHIGLISLLFSIGCLALWRSTYRVYYKRMGFAYQVITDLELTQPRAESPTPA